MARWQHARFFLNLNLLPHPPLQVWVESTDPAVVDWVVDQVRQRDPQSYILETKQDVDGVTYRAVLQLSAGRDPYAFIALLRRLMCDDGWEPYGTGTDCKRQL